jgi:uncharacterized protein (TIGR02271 family)
VRPERLEEARRRRARVVDSGGERLGRFETIYYDDATGEPVWIGVRTASEPPRRVLAPVDGAVLAEGAVRLAHDRQTIEATEAVEAESIDAEAENALRSHYGLPPELVRFEEELRVEKEREPIGAVRVRKRLEGGAVEEEVVREVEHAGLERVAVEGEDSGLVETLPDGSISIPVFEEELVVTKRLVVRERVIVRKEKRIEQETITDELRRERVQIEVDPGVELHGDIE